MRLIKVLIGVLIVGMIAWASASNIHFTQVDSQRLRVSCANGADPTVVAADAYNTIVISCTDERAK